MAARFRSNVWDPVLIIAQIVCMQCLFYVTASMLTLLLSLCFLSSAPNLRWLFDDRQMQFQSSSGKCLLTVFLLTPLVCAVGLWRLVRRSKQCLDFACTIHFWHLVICICYSHHFPRTLLWWLANTISIIIATVMGEFLCMRYELRAIPLGSNSIPTNC